LRLPEDPFSDVSKEWLRSPFGCAGHWTWRGQPNSAEIYPIRGSRLAVRRAFNLKGARQVFTNPVGLQQLHDVVGCVLERDEQASARQRYRIVE
jgi:hypothetical protein